MEVVEFANTYKEVNTQILSVLSLLISLIALCVSCRSAWYDRAILKINSRLVYHGDSERALYIEIVVTNIGRRDAVLEGVLRHYEEGHTSYTVEEGGITVKEKNRVKFIVDFQEIIMSGDEGEVYALEDLTILDIENKEHEIPNSQELIKRFREKN